MKICVLWLVGLALVPCCALYAEPFAYVTGWTTNLITVVDLATNTVVTQIHVTGGTPPETAYIAITPDNKSAYVSCYGDSSVKQIDIATNTVVASIPTSSKFALGIAITPDGKKAYVANQYYSNNLTPIDLTTNTPGAPILGMSSSSDVAITPDGKTAYVTDGSGGVVFPIDVATNVLGVPITMGTYPAHIAITPDGKTAYVSNLTSNEVIPIDLTTNTPGTSIPFDAPYGIAITHDSKKAYVCNYYPSPDPPYTSYVTPIDLTTNTPGTPIALGAVSGNPNDIAINPDGKTAYVTIGNNLVPIDIATDTIGTPIDGVTWAFGIAVTFQTSISGPIDVIGRDTANRFLNRTEHVLSITLEASTSINVAYYNVYCADTVIEKVLATAPLFFARTFCAPVCANCFSITAVNAEKKESDHVPVRIQYE